MKLIDRDTLQRKLAGAQAPLLVEALPEKYFQDWHLPGARHMPHDQVRALAASVLPDKAAGIVVYCASRTCQNSHIAAKTLEQLGYTDVAVYACGNQDWSEAGVAVERGEPAPVCPVPDR